MNQDVFAKIANNPSGSADLVYQHSAPIALSFLSPDILGLVTFDPVKQGSEFNGKYHVAAIDVSKRKICTDVVLPISAESMPPITMSHDTITVFEQALTKNDETFSSVKRLVVSTQRCKWISF